MTSSVVRCDMCGNIIHQPSCGCDLGGTISISHPHSGDESMGYPKECFLGEVCADCMRYVIMMIEYRRKTKRR